MTNMTEQEYLDKLNRKIDEQEGRHIKTELGVALFVVPAQMILKLGIASVALVGSMRLISGELSLVTFFLFLMVVSRPVIGAHVGAGMCALVYTSDKDLDR